MLDRARGRGSCLVLLRTPYRGNIPQVITHSHCMWCRQEERRQAINEALERRSREDREVDAVSARDAQRRKEEQERQAKDVDDKLRAQEEFQAWLQAEIKRNKQAKASK